MAGEQRADEFVTISRDSFLGPLGLHEVEGRVRGKKAGDGVYASVVAYLIEEGRVVDLDDRVADSDGINELGFKVPGLPLTVRISGISQEEIALLATAAVLVFGVHVPGTETATVASFLAALRRVRKVRTQYGELSVLEALGEGRPTAEGVVLRLFNRVCRHPTAGCQFLGRDTGLCLISKDAAVATLEELSRTSVLRRMNVVPPIEYKVAF